MSTATSPQGKVYTVGPFKYTIMEHLGFKLIDTEHFRKHSIDEMDEHVDDAKRGKIRIRDILCTLIHHVKPSAVFDFLDLKVEYFSMTGKTNTDNSVIIDRCNTNEIRVSLHHIDKS